MTGLQIDQFLAANGAYAGEFDKGSLPLPPGRKVAVVVCMDVSCLDRGVRNREEAI